MKKYVLIILSPIILFSSLAFLTRPNADDSFLSRAGQANMAEIAAGNLAVSKGSSSEVRKYGQKMVTDHTAAQKELIALAHKEEATIPKEPDTGHINFNAQLAKLSGKPFDSAYLKNQLLDHQVAVNLFQEEVSHGSDPDAVAYAKKYLPKLKSHLKMFQAADSAENGAMAADTSQDSVFHFTTSDGVQLYVHTAGHGNPCLFIHGGPGLTSYYFEALPVAKLMEQKMRMIYFDQRGSGRSASAKDSNYSMKRMEKDIEELRTSLNIKTWSLLGHSFGGLIMTAYAKDYPEKIRALVYAHCTLNIQSSLNSHIDNGLMLLKSAGDTFHVDKQLTPFNQMIQVHAELAKKGIEYKIMFRTQRAKDIDDSITNATTTHFNQDFSHYVWNSKEYWTDYTPYTRDILCPVLIISGTRDYAVGPDSYKSWQFKNEKVVLYDGAHFSFLEEPVWFADTVLQFLENK